MNTRNGLIAILMAMLGSGCMDKERAALDDLAQNEKELKLCTSKNIVFKKKKLICEKINLEISMQNALVLGIDQSRINAALILGEKQAELENSNLVKKAELIQLAEMVEIPDTYLLAKTHAYESITEALNYDRIAKTRGITREELADWKAARAAREAEFEAAAKAAELGKLKVEEYMRLANEVKVSDE